MLYSPPVSCDSTHACEFCTAAETSWEFDRDLPPGSQLLRSRPRLSSRVGLWPSVEPGVAEVLCELPVSVLAPGGCADVLLPRASGPGDGARTPTMGNEPFRPSKNELLLFRGSALSFLSFAGDVAETALGEGAEVSLVGGAGACVGGLPFRSFAGIGGGASEGGKGAAIMLGVVGVMGCGGVCSG